MMNTRRPFIERSMLFANLAAQKTAAGSVLAMTLSMAALLLGIFLLESVLSPGPTIPHPPLRSLPVTTSEARQQLFNPDPLIVTLFVYPKDADRLARTLEADVIRHGGWIRSNPNDRNLAFAISQQYLERMQLLIDSTDLRQVGNGYTEWANAVATIPSPELHRVPPDTVLRVNLRFPPAAHPASLPVMAVTGSIIGAAFLTLLCCVVVYRCTRRQNTSG